MEMLFLLISTMFLLVFLSLIFYQSRLRHKNLPPSPRALPIIGHLHLLKHPMHRTLYRLFQKHGPIIILRLGSRPVIIVSSSSAAEECFTKNDIIFANRPKLLLGKYVAYNHTTVVQAPYGDHWRNLRRICAIEMFSTHRLNKLASIRKDEIKRLMVNLTRNSLQGFSKVELKSKFRELTFNIMIRMIAGKRYYGDEVSDEEEARQFRQILKETASYGGVSNPGDFLPILNWLDGGKFKRTVIGYAKRIDAFFQGLIDEHRRKKANLESMNNTMIDHLLSLQESEPEYYTDEIIKGLIQVMIFAGTDTTSVTIEWAMSNLLNHPKMLKKTRDEIDKQAGEKCLLDEYHLSKLPYLQNIISETLRLYPSAPLLVPHMSSTVGGYDVPRGTMLLVNAWAIHRDPTIWDDANIFKPERFDSGEADRTNKLMPFGLGRRSCPGAGLAQRVVGLALGSLIQCFEWKRVSEKEIDMFEDKGITMPKAEPLEAMCKSRPIMKTIPSSHI
ncbi:cytochrome P450 81Q32-like [Mercurialis annua]|uniref:cytochrome P450 81Q32-like n=1 Tax=Mercurialis annua TaxID=3986 RepID=UPI002160E20A|nr:cytochrome P450 81Q32-like [Mercurialis annua]